MTVGERDRRILALLGRHPAKVIARMVDVPTPAVYRCAARHNRPVSMNRGVLVEEARQILSAAGFTNHQILAVLRE